MMGDGPGHAPQALGLLRLLKLPLELEPLLLGPLALGDVPYDADDCRPSGQARHTQGHFDGNGAAVLAHLATLECELLTCKDSFPQLKLSGLDRLGIDVLYRLGKQFLPGIA